MATRDDITIAWYESPRIATVAAPSTDISIQDLHDTLRDIESRISNNIYPSLLSTSGKEVLDESTNVGLTLNLKNAQLSFEARPNSISVGSSSSLDLSGILLTTTSGTFLSDNVGRGDIITNQIDGSSASVLQVLSELQLTCSPLVGGTDNQWDVNDGYAIYDVIQCNVDGGNLVATTLSGLSLDPVFPTFGTQVVRTSSASATLSSQEALEASLFSEGVVIDIINGTSGIKGTQGSREFPVNNIVDAISIAQTRGLRKFAIVQPMTIANVDLSFGYIFTGDHPATVVLTLDPSANLSNCQFFNIQVNGELDGANVVQQSAMGVVTGLSGFVFQTTLGTSTTLGGPVNILQSFSGVPGAGKPILDINGGNSVSVRDYRGSLKIQNATGYAVHTIEMEGGNLEFDSTVVSGVFQVRGSLASRIVDNSGPNAIIVDGTSTTFTIERFENIHKLVESQRDSHQSYGFIFYWDPVNGDDANDGLSESKPKLTFQSAHDETMAFRGDIIFAINGNVGAVTTVTTPIKITKQRVSLRGPGRAFNIVVNSATQPAVWLNAEGCSVDGLAIKQTNAAQPGLLQDKHNGLIRNTIVYGCASHGVEITGTALASPAIVPVNLIENLESIANAGHALYIHDDVGLTFIRDRTHLEESGGDGLRMENNVDDVHCSEVITHENAGYGINLADSTVGNTALIDIRYVKNIAGDLNDEGTDTTPLNPGESVTSHPKTLTVPKFLGLK